MLAVKAVKQNISNSEVNPLLETFRQMINEAIRVGMEKNITSRFRLQKEVYNRLHNGLHTWYILSAVEKACAILKNYRKAKRKNPKTKKPYVKKPFLSIGNQAYRIIDGKLRLPTQPRKFIYIPLNKYTLKVLSEPNLKLGSITLTANTVSISFSKETAEIEPSGYIGIDRNLDNVTTASSNGEVTVYDLSKATRVKAVYNDVRSHFRRNDARIRKCIFGKYGGKQRNGVNQILHNVSKQIVEQAEKKRLGIVMENLKGIRRLYRKGNGQGRRFRGRMNSWSFYELQRQVEYKARWKGLPIIYVSPQKTSSNCAICGSKILECTERQVYCQTCNKSVDRDVNAAKNILARGLRFTPVGQPVEAMVSVKR